MRSRSFHTVMNLITVMLMLFGLLSGCVSESIIDNPDITTLNPIKEIDTASSEISFTEEEVQAIVDEAMTGDYSSLTDFSDEEREAFIDAMQEYDISLNDAQEDDGAVPPPSGLSACSGYWGTNHSVETVEVKSDARGLLYSVGPNCFMWAPGSDCGTDYDDYMLSFYFGYHGEGISTLKSMLKWSSSNLAVMALMGSLDGRLYQQTAGGGADNYNFYACVDDGYGGYLETFTLRKY